MLASVVTWFVAARPKTLTAAGAPVLVGLALATLAVDLNWMIALVTLFSAVFIQVGTNYANDYYDFLKGSDTDSRLGPPRAILTGDVKAGHMLSASLISFFISALLGLLLIWHGGWAILVIGSVSLLSGFFYTAGPYPLAYLGLGDIFVYVFFGPVAVLGTYYLQTGIWSMPALWTGSACGLLTNTILVVNNQRDVEEDRAANKKTVAVRFGVGFTKVEYVACYVLTAVCIIGTIFCFGNSQWLSLLVLLPSIENMMQIGRVDTAAEYNKLLENSAKSVLLYAILVIIGVVVFG